MKQVLNYYIITLLHYQQRREITDDVKRDKNQPRTKTKHKMVSNESERETSNSYEAYVKNAAKSTMEQVKKRDKSLIV